MLFFKVDINKYYSDTKANYFTFTYSNSSNIIQIEKLIWIGLTFSNITNFIYILPRVLCVYCNIYNTKWCSYINCWKIRNLNNCFSGRYRENVFFIYCIVIVFHL